MRKDEMLPNESMKGDKSVVGTQRRSGRRASLGLTCRRWHGSRAPYAMREAGASKIHLHTVITGNSTLMHTTFCLQILKSRGLFGCSGECGQTYFNIIYCLGFFFV